MLVLKDVVKVGICYCLVDGTVRCFNCELEVPLKDLMNLKSEDIWKKHATGRGDCGFLRLCKGDTVIDKICDEVKVKVILQYSKLFKKYTTLCVTIIFSLKIKILFITFCIYITVLLIFF